MNRTLVVLTDSYPYHPASEQSFLDPEVPHLLRAFDRVIVVPSRVGGERSDLPSGVALDESLAGVPSVRGRKRILLTALRSPWVYDEMVRRAGALRRLAGLRRLLAFTAEARTVRDWVPRFLRKWEVESRGTVFYTYWLSGVTLGLVLARTLEPRLRVVSRAHGYDLYEERHSPAYLPGRRRLLRSLDRLFTVSENGRQYLRRLYPEDGSRVLAVSRLGTSDPGIRTPASTDGVFRVLSCSAVIPVKRLDRLAEGLASAARAQPARAIEWHHLGGGGLEDELRATLKHLAPGNLRYHLLGQVAHGAVLAFYRQQPVDLFVNTSESEGLPVAIMEASSHGIPSLAPSIGGIPELVDPETGYLMGPQPMPQEVTASLVSVLDDPAGLERRRLAARRRWEERCDAARNFPAFAAELRTLAEWIPG